MDRFWRGFSIYKEVRSRNEGQNEKSRYFLPLFTVWYFRIRAGASAPSTSPTSAGSAASSAVATASPSLLPTPLLSPSVSSLLLSSSAAVSPAITAQATRATASIAKHKRGNGKENQHYGSLLTMNNNTGQPRANTLFKKSFSNNLVITRICQDTDILLILLSLLSGALQSLPWFHIRIPGCPLQLQWLHPYPSQGYDNIQR